MKIHDYVKLGSLINFLIFLGIILSAVLIYRYESPVTVLHTSWHSSAGSSGILDSVPFSQLTRNEEYADVIYKIDIAVKQSSGLILKIIPDDRVNRIYINGHYISLDNISPAALSDFRQGFSLPVGDHLSKGTSSITIHTSNLGGSYGILFEFVCSKRLLREAILYLVFFLILAVYRLMGNRAYSFSLKIAFIVGIIERIFYFLVTAPGERGHDLGWHTSYIASIEKLDIESILQHWSLHPPTYYLIGYWISIMLKFFGVEDPQVLLKFLQLFSTFTSIGALFFTLNTLSLLFGYAEKGRFTDYLTAHVCSNRAKQLLKFCIFMLAATWPSYVLHSARIGNESLTYLFIAIAFWKIVSWYCLEDQRALIFSLVYAFLATITKSVGLILFAIIAICFFCKRFSASARFPSERTFFLVAIFLTFFTISSVITFGPAVRDKLNGTRNDIFIANANSVTQALRVGNRAQNFLWFDLKMFINSPFSSPWDDNLGRQFYGNYLAKTALFGEFSFPSTVLSNLAVYISWLAGLLFLLSVACLFYLTREDMVKFLPCWLTIFLYVAAIYFVRMLCPVNIDFRYIAQILPAILFLLWYAGQWYFTRPSLRIAYLMTCAVFLSVVCSFIFNIVLLVNEWYDPLLFS